MSKQSFNNKLHHQFVETSQGRIAIWDTKPDSEKKTPTVIFIHGFCTNKSFFQNQFSSPFFGNYRLIALDLPGHGESDPPTQPEKVYSFPGFADVVSEVVSHLELENLIVVGWSLGGHVGLELISRLPQLKGLLITGTPPIEISAEGMGKGFKISDPKILECFGKANMTYEEAELLATISGYDYSEEKKFIVDAVMQTDEGAKTIYPKSIIHGIGQNELTIVRESLLPIAVIAGEEDAGINNEYIIRDVEFKNLWREKVHLIANAGHSVFIEQPDKFNQILSQFFQEVFENCNK